MGPEIVRDAVVDDFHDFVVRLWRSRLQGAVYRTIRLDTDGADPWMHW